MKYRIVEIMGLAGNKHFVAQSTDSAENWKDIPETMAFTADESEKWLKEYLSTPQPRVIKELEL